MGMVGYPAKKAKQQNPYKQSRYGQKYEQREYERPFYQVDGDFYYQRPNPFGRSNPIQKLQQYYHDKQKPIRKFNKMEQEPDRYFDSLQSSQETYPMITFANIQNKLITWIRNDNGYDNKQLIDDFEYLVKQYHSKNKSKYQKLNMEKKYSRLNESPTFPKGKLDLQKALGTLIMTFPDKPCLKFIVGLGFLVSDSIALFCCENYFQLQYYRGYKFSLLFRSYHTKQFYKITEELRIEDSWGYKNVCIVKLSESLPFFSGCLIANLQDTKKGQNASYYRFSIEDDQNEYVYKQNLIVSLIDKKGRLQKPFEQRSINLIFCFKKSKFSLLIAPVSDSKSKKGILNFAKELIEYGVSPNAFSEEIKNEIILPKYMKKLSYKPYNYTYSYHEQYEYIDKGKYRNNNQKDLSQIKKKIIHNQRFSGPIDFKIMNCYIRFIQVNSVRLYFQIYSKESKEKMNYYQSENTIILLNRQYQRIKKKGLILHGQNIKIPLALPLHLITDSQKGIKLLETTLKMLNQEDYIPNLPYSKGQVEKLWNQYLTRSKGYNQISFFSSPNDIIEVIIRKRQTLLIKKYIKVNKQTKISDIIDELKLEQNFNYDLFNIYVDKKRRIDEKEYDLRIDQIMRINRVLDFELISSNCLLSGDSLIKIKEHKTQNILTQSLNVIKKIVNQDSFITFSFEQYQKIIIQQKINKIGEAKPIFSYYSILLKGTEQFQIQCSQQTYFYCKDRWIAINQLQIGTLLLGVPPKIEQQYQKSKQKYFITQYSVMSIKRIVLKEPKFFYPVSVAKTHNLIVNNLIVHNRNPINLTIMQITQDGELKYKITVYRNEKIRQKFNKLPVYLCGNILQNQLTYGDYNIQSPYHLVVRNKISQNYQKRQQLNFTCSTQLSVLDKAQIENAYDLLKSEFLCIYKNQIIPISIELINRLIHIEEQSILIQPKTLLKRMEFIHRVKKYCSYSEILFSNLQTIKQSFQFQKILEVTADECELSDNDKLLIHTYTGQIYPPYSQQTYYRAMNALLRTDDSFLVNSDLNNLLLCMAGLLIQSVSYVEELQQYSTFYRGIGFALDEILKNKVGNILIMEGFTSTSTDLRQARNFSVPGGIVLQIKTLNGKSIQKYSRIKKQKQVLLLPYTYFIIQELPSQDQQFLRLTEIPLPYSNKNKIIFWVDDFPALNYITISQLSEQFEVVRVTTTAVMKIIIQKFLWVYKLLGKTIIIISDMVRQEQNFKNYKAGAELFDIIFNDLGLSDKAFIYAGDVEKSTESLKEKNVPSPSQRIFVEGKRLLQEIEKYRERE